MVLVWLKTSYFFFFYQGTTAKRRSTEIKRLNARYVDTIPMKHTIQKCLKYLCENEPYRMLSDWSYEMEAEPLPSDQGTSTIPELTDVNIP